MQTSNNEDDVRLLSAPLSHVIEYVVGKHHGFLRTQTQSIEQLIDQLFETNQGNKRIEELRRLNRTLSSELMDHMSKEEDLLFPAIISLEQAARLKAPDCRLLPFKIENRIRLMMLEDEGTVYLLKHFTQGLLAYQPPPESQAIYQHLSAAIHVFENDLKRHIYVENTILFPKAIEVERGLSVR